MRSMKWDPIWKRDGKLQRYVEGKFHDNSHVPGLKSRQSKLEPDGEGYRKHVFRKEMKTVLPLVFEYVESTLLSVCK